MHPLTRRGICYELNSSPYTFIYDNLLFYFSSTSYLQKFKENVDLFCDIEKTNFNLNHAFKINDNKVFAIIFYKQIEKRGFLVKNNGENIQNLSIIIDF